MKTKIIMISFMALISTHAFAANNADTHISKAQALIGSAKNYNAHIQRVNNVTNNRPKGMPGVIDRYQKRQNALYNEKIQAATRLAKSSLQKAKQSANSEHLIKIEELHNEIAGL